MESTTGWFLKESFSYSELFNNFDCGNILALKYTHAQKKKKKCKHIPICLLSFADAKNLKSFLLTQKKYGITIQS